MKDKRFLLGLSSGILLALSFPPYPFFLFAFIGLIPILTVFNLVKRKWLLVYLVFFIYHYATNWWISSWQKDTDPYLFISGFAVAFIHPLLFMIPFLLLHFFSIKLGYKKSLFLFPFIWIFFEWFHSLGDLAYPWLTLGYTQAYNHYLIQIADIGGVWLISFLIVWVNVLILFATDPTKRKHTISFVYFIRNKYFLTAIVLVFCGYIYGFFRSSQFNGFNLLEKYPTLRVAIVQPNINPWRKWDTSPLHQIETHQKVQDSLFSIDSNIDLVVWSETAITFLDLDINAHHNFEQFYNLIKEKNFSLLTGFADFVIHQTRDPIVFTTKFLYGDTTKPYDTYNSILLLNPIGQQKYQIYHKMRLTPFGEHIPYSQILGFAKKFLEWNVGISSWAKGKEQKILNLITKTKSASISPIICIESIYPNFVRSSVKLGANIITIITNDGWYDHTFGPEQHFLIAKFRAIENRRFVVRCANTGISGFIDPSGRTNHKIPPYTKIGTTADVPILSFSTIYLELGDWICYASTAVIIGCFPFTFRRRTGSQFGWGK